MRPLSPDDVVPRLRGDVVIADDLTVSRRHAELVRSSGRARIVDLGSSGGTFVDGVRVREAVRDAFVLGRAFDFITPFVTAAGRQRWVRLIGEPHEQNRFAFIPL